ncbi:YigZ family protein [Flavobacterium columnare]|nr:YigZ family protein [Flavobacterium columnare]MBF6654640.1 YigZ family protein [Flavobacterium columnare]MBF6657161.1 YigZ family protein [Flavobacterium columnare]PDS23444.1 YigZ family protein [Flavobacterium columnare] [Flavobacterium columnare NBRC 100251 = ATCC 23463]PTD16439.1 YigZ family protein [Flavobacterium columnare]
MAFRNRERRYNKPTLKKRNPSLTDFFFIFKNNNFVLKSYLLHTEDTYITLKEDSPEVLYKEKNSKFYGYAFPVSNEEEIKAHLEHLKKKHHAARHWCYAWQLGTTQKHYRANDDGEPNNSAGMPIYGQIQSFELTNVLVIVVRYFGGIKLGVGGLISAYRESAKMALEASSLVERTIDIQYKVNFDYKNMNKVMRVIKEKEIHIISQKMEESCELIISTRQKNADMVFGIFSSFFEVTISVF